MENPIEQSNKEKNNQSPNNGMSRDELLEIFRDQLKSMNELPPHVRGSFCLYTDLENAMLLIYGILTARQD